MAEGEFSTEGDFGGSSTVPAGEQYTSTLGFHPPPVATPVVPEKTVRPFESFRERRDQRLLQLRQIPPEDNLAQSCWGGVTNGDTAPDVASPGLNLPNFSTQKPDGGGAPNKDDPATENWNEIERSSEEIEVESEDDPDISVFILVARESLIEIPSLSVSKVSGSGKNKTTTTFTIPARKARIKWKELDRA